MKTKMIWILNSYERNLKATLGGDGKLRISDDLFKKLPDYIRFSFETKSRVLYIVGCREEDNGFKKRKTMTVPGLVFCLMQEGLSTPISFRCSYSDKGAKWTGKPYISRNREDFAVQFLILKKPMVQTLVYTKAQSMPCEDRWQIANIALLEATRICHPSHSDFDEFARWLIIKRLKEENKAYVKYSSTLSLDASRKNGDGDVWCLYDKIGSNVDINKEAEDNLLRRDFKMKSERLMKMLMSGYKLPQIAEALNISEEEVYRLAEMIGEMRMGADRE